MGHEVANVGQRWEGSLQSDEGEARWELVEVEVAFL